MFKNEIYDQLGNIVSHEVCWNSNFIKHTVTILQFFDWYTKYIYTCKYVIFIYISTYLMAKM